MLTAKLKDYKLGMMILIIFKKEIDKFFLTGGVYRSQRGQSLIEVMAALGVVAVVIVGIAILAFSSLKDVQHGRNQVQASRLVAEGLEQVRIVRDQIGWSKFYATYNIGCYKVDTSSSPYTMQSIDCGGEWLSVPLAQFRRLIVLEDQHLVDPDAGCSLPGCPGRKITASVFWEDTQGQQTSAASTVLTQWK